MIIQKYLYRSAIVCVLSFSPVVCMKIENAFKQKDLYAAGLLLDKKSTLTPQDFTKIIATIDDPKEKYTRAQKDGIRILQFLARNKKLNAIDNLVMANDAQNLEAIVRADQELAQPILKKLLDRSQPRPPLHKELETFTTIWLISPGHVKQSFRNSLLHAAFLNKVNNVSPNYDLSLLRIITNKNPDYRVSSHELKEALAVTTPAYVNFLLESNPALLNRSMSPEQPISQTPLFWAAKNGRPDLVEVFLEKRARLPKLKEPEFLPVSIKNRLAEYKNTYKELVGLQEAQEQVENSLVKYLQLSKLYEARNSNKVDITIDGLKKKSEQFSPGLQSVLDCLRKSNIAPQDLWGLSNPVLHDVNMLKKINADLVVRIKEYSDYIENNSTCGICSDHYRFKKFVITCSNKHTICISCFNNPLIQTCPFCRESIPFEKLKICQGCNNKHDHTKFYYCNDCSTSNVMCPDCNILPCCKRAKKATLSEEHIKMVEKAGLGHIESYLKTIGPKIEATEDERQKKINAVIRALEDRFLLLEEESEAFVKKIEESNKRIEGYKSQLEKIGHSGYEGEEKHIIKKLYDEAIAEKYDFIHHKNNVMVEIGQLCQDHSDIITELDAEQYKQFTEELLMIQAIKQMAELTDLDLEENGRMCEQQAAQQRAEQERSDFELAQRVQESLNDEIVSNDNPNNNDNG